MSILTFYTFLKKGFKLNHLTMRINFSLISKLIQMQLAFEERIRMHTNNYCINNISIILKMN